MNIFEGVPTEHISNELLQQGIPIVDFLADVGKVSSSKGEARRSLKENSISINKGKVNEQYVVSDKDLLNNKYILIQKGKKNYYLVIVDC